MKNNNIIYTLILFITLLLPSCDCGREDELFYKKADILDIKRDDESQYHLLVRYEDGTTESVADVKCTIKMGDYEPKANMPFVRWESCNGLKGALNAWNPNSSKYSYLPIDITLPIDYKIELFND